MKFLERALDGQNQWWKYVLVFLIAFFGGQFVGSLPFMAVMAIKVSAAGGQLNAESLMNFEAVGMSKNLAFGLMMTAPFLTMVFTVLLVKALHNRTFSDTVSGRKTIRWKRALFAFCLWFGLMAVYMTADYFYHRDNYVLQFDSGKFIVLLVLAVIFVPPQAASEELLMRGYLTQGIGAGTKSRWVAWLIPSFIFGILHIGNPEVAKFGLVLSMSQYLFFGLFFGLVAILDDGIELSIGMHVANNLFLSLFATHPDSALQTDALFSLKEIDPVMDFVSLIVVAVIAFAVFYRKYGWHPGVMNKKVNTVNREQ
jgi:membrane protease YdiL (CAAX protease family)